jgi:hypothetical protein
VGGGWWACATMFTRDAYSKNVCRFRSAPASEWLQTEVGLGHRHLELPSLDVYGLGIWCYEWTSADCSVGLVSDWSLSGFSWLVVSRDSSYKLQLQSVRVVSLCLSVDSEDESVCDKQDLRRI